MNASKRLRGAVEPNSSEGLDCDRAARCENNAQEPEGRPQDVVSGPHTNVTVKEEEEEEALCGMLT